MTAPGPTDREIEVLRTYVRLGSRKEAAAELGISEATVKSHLSSLYRRLHVFTAAQAIAQIRKRGPSVKA